MKTNEELKHLKEKCETLKQRIMELSEEELDEVVGGKLYRLDGPELRNINMTPENYFLFFLLKKPQDLPPMDKCP